MLVLSIILGTAFVAYATTSYPATRLPHGDANVPNSYVVVLKSNASVATHLIWLEELQLPKKAWKTDLRRYAGELQVSDDVPESHQVLNSFNLGPELQRYDIHANEHVMEQIRQHPDVDFVEQHQYVYTLSQSPSQQPSPPWGLGRISHRGPSNSSWPYLFSPQGLGAGVDLYILDSGILSTHVEFSGRIAEGTSVLPSPENSTADAYYHGTHCAGTAAGTTFGVAKAATIIPVKILGRNGVASQMYLDKGLVWALERHKRRLQDPERRRREGFKGSVVNLSVGLKQRSRSIDRMLKFMAEAGMHLVAAAGNEASDACARSPGGSEHVITVGAVDEGDGFAGEFSNWGACVDVNAPGVDVRSAGFNGTTAEIVASGTSMAAPHVAGIVAGLLSRVEGEGGVEPKRLKEDLLRISSKGLISGETLGKDTVDAIAYNGGGWESYEDAVGHYDE